MVFISGTVQALAKRGGSVAVSVAMAFAVMLVAFIFMMAYYWLWHGNWSFSCIVRRTVLIGGIAAVPGFLLGRAIQEVIPDSAIGMAFDAATAGPVEQAAPMYAEQQYAAPVYAEQQYAAPVYAQPPPQPMYAQQQAPVSYMPAYGAGEGGSVIDVAKQVAQPLANAAKQAAQPLMNVATQAAQQTAVNAAAAAAQAVPCPPGCGPKGGDPEDKYVTEKHVTFPTLESDVTE
jgi:hypothetical protein